MDPGDPTALLCSLVMEPDAVFPGWPRLLKRQEHKSLSQFLLDLLLRVEPDFPEPVLPAVLESTGLLTRAELLPQQGTGWQVGGLQQCWNQQASYQS